jgi:NAD dependent epimerase/dehydratase family enzyme
MTQHSRPTAVVAGASGFIGKAVVQALADDGYDVRRIGRRESITWADPAALAAAVDGADLLVNFAGKSVNCRYGDANRDEILRSRVETTRALHRAVAAAAHPPSLWLNASTATIYRHSVDCPNTEEDGRLGEGFSVDVARSWERELFAGDLPGTRRVAMRMAIVLGDGPAARMLLGLARTGLGGPQIDGWCPPHRRYRGIGAHPTGSLRAPWYRTHGRQHFSWVHVDDVVGAIRFVRDHPDIAGPVNIASPNPSDNTSLMRILRRIVGMPIGIPSWRWMLEPAMWVLRTEPELVLKSRWVLPGVLADAGYEFRHPDLEEALRNVVAARNG